MTQNVTFLQPLNKQESWRSYLSCMKSGFLHKISRRAYVLGGLNNTWAASTCDLVGDVAKPNAYAALLLRFTCLYGGGDFV